MNRVTMFVAVVVFVAMDWAFIAGRAVLRLPMWVVGCITAPSEDCGFID